MIKLTTPVTIDVSGEQRSQIADMIVEGCFKQGVLFNRMKKNSTGSSGTVDDNALLTINEIEPEPVLEQKPSEEGEKTDDQNNS